MNIQLMSTPKSHLCKHERCAGKNVGEYAPQLDFNQDFYSAILMLIILLLIPTASKECYVCVYNVIFKTCKTWRVQPCACHYCLIH